MDERTLNKKLKFIENYKQACNAASGSEVDANANVTTKNVATMSSELSKPDFIDVNRAITKKYLLIKYGQELCDQFDLDLKNHIIYSHDESSIMPYCVAISLYPFLLDGLKKLGGTSGPPKHSDSFIGGLTNLVFLIAGQFAGAVAVPEFLPYLDHFLRVDYGEDYITNLDETVEAFGNRRATLRNKIEDLFQQFVYCINQPAGARGYQSPFTNIAYFDKGYFNSIFKDFIFPDGDEPNWESTKELQKMFMNWFNNERTHDVITFPVETMNLLWDKDTHKYVDEEMADFTAEMWSKGHSFFLYNSDSADALASCCFKGNELITIRHKTSLKIITMPISTFCINHSKDYSDYETMSYNIEKDMIEYSDITGVLIKDNEYPNLIKIESEDGSVLEVTPEHVLLVVDNVSGDKVEIKAKDLVNNFERYELIKKD